MKARPYEYVGQEQVALSTAPVWDHGHISSRSLVLRTFVINSGSGWVAMPGGLVRVAGADGPVVSMQRGGRTKDAWVLCDTPPDSFSMLRPRSQTVQLQRTPAELPSRAADNLFWLGRYAERSECVARLLRSLMTRVRHSRPNELNCLFRLHGCFGSAHSTLPIDHKPTARQLEDELISLMSDARRPDSLVANLGEVLRIGGALRERLSSDMSRLIVALSESVMIHDYMLFVEYTAALSGCLELLSALLGPRWKTLPVDRAGYEHGPPSRARSLLRASVARTRRRP